MSSHADYNLRILWTLARYVEQRYGAGRLSEVAEAGGLRPADFDGSSRWIGWQTFEAVLAKARSLMASDEEFKAAFKYRFMEAYGPLRYVLWATTPAQVLAQAAKQYRLVSTSGDLTLTGRGRTWAHVRFESHVPFSRLACLARHGNCEALPTLWGLPPGHLKEERCIAWGDASCELRVHWYEGRHWLPVVLGGALFAAVGYGLLRAGVASPIAPVAFAVIGALLSYVFEGRRAERANAETRAEVMAALVTLGNDEQAARRELLEMHGRQKEWTRLVEDEMSSRATALQDIVASVRDVEEARASKVLGFSHDLRNPLQIVLASAEYLEEIPAVTADPGAVECLHDLTQSAQRMRGMLTDLVQVAKSQREFVTMDPKRLGTAQMMEALGRRLRALVYGRDVRTSVFATRETPESLRMDPILLDRIVDNLLTNAAKYTERGNIVAELDGTPEYLVIKVSDTGKGIAPEDVDRIFQPGGSSLESRRGDSFGVGLSVVVQLLDQMGGRLEVLSRLGSGTTFWVYLPLETSQGRASRPDAVESLGPALSRVVTVRRLPS